MHVSHKIKTFGRRTYSNMKNILFLWEQETQGISKESIHSTVGGLCMKLP